MADKKSPLALAVIARLKKANGHDEPDGDEPEDSEGKDEGEDSSASDEAELSACEDMIAAFRERDAHALRDALKSFLKACGVEGYDDGE